MSFYIIDNQTSTCSKSQSSQIIHSNQIGWASDGFPIYGPFGNNGEMKYCGDDSYSMKNTNCLDSCGGIEEWNPTIDNYQYRCKCFLYSLIIFYLY